MLDEILELQHYSVLMENEALIKCTLCDYVAVTIGAMNHHIGTKHLGKLALLKRKEQKVDKK